MDISLSHTQARTWTAGTFRKRTPSGLASSTLPQGRSRPRRRPKRAPRRARTARFAASSSPPAHRKVTAVHPNPNPSHCPTRCCTDRCTCYVPNVFTLLLRVLASLPLAYLNREWKVKGRLGECVSTSAFKSTKCLDKNGKGLPDTASTDDNPAMKGGKTTTKK